MQHNCITNETYRVNKSAHPRGSMNSTKVNGSHHEMILLADLCPEIEVI